MRECILFLMERDSEGTRYHVPYNGLYHTQHAVKKCLEPWDAGVRIRLEVRFLLDTSLNHTVKQIAMGHLDARNFNGVDGILREFA